MPSWKRLIVSGSDANLSSLSVDSSISAASFSGSFSGSFEGDAVLNSVNISNGTTISGSVIISGSQQNTGSLSVSGSVTADQFNISDSAVGSPSIYSSNNLNLSASNAVVVTSSPFRVATFNDAQTGSISAQTGDIIFNSTRGTYTVYSGSSWIDLIISGSDAILKSIISSNGVTVTGSLLLSGSQVITGSLSVLESIDANLAGTASFATISDFAKSSGTASLAIEGSGSFSGSFQGDGSNLTGVGAFPYTGSAGITGSLNLTGNANIIGGANFDVFATAQTASGDSIIPDGYYAKMFGPVLVSGTVTVGTGSILKVEPF